MPVSGNVPSSVRALGVDIGSTNVKAAVVGIDDGLRELAVAQRPVPADAAGLIDAALAAIAEVVAVAGGVHAVGITSMAETGALVDADARPAGPLLRWDRGDAAARLALAADLDHAAVHAATGVPLTAKTPLLTWGALARAGRLDGLRWGFCADLVALALTGRLATDHTLAGRSGALALPPAGAPLGTAWDAGLLQAIGVPAGLPPDIRRPGEAVGDTLPIAGLAARIPVHVAGHDHAVVARLCGMAGPGTVAHSLGTTEAVLALAAPDAPIDRARAGRDGISIVRGVDGELEGALAGSPAAGSMVADWRARTGAEPEASRGKAAGALVLPYPLGRQAPAPDPDARAVLLGAAGGSPDAELAGILRGLAAHGAWLRATVAALCGLDRAVVVAAGAPVRGNRRLPGLMAALAGGPLPVVDLAAPAAVGAAALAAQRAGLAELIAPPMRVVPPDDDGAPDLAHRFADAVGIPTSNLGAPG